MKRLALATLALVGIVIGTASITAVHPAHATPPDPCRAGCKQGK